LSPPGRFHRILRRGISQHKPDFLQIASAARRNNDAPACFVTIPGVYRLLQALLSALRAALFAFWRAARQLWHEVIGVFFGLFALLGAVSAWRHWQRGSELYVLAVSLAFFLVMAGFAVASFRSARRVR